MHVAVIFKLKIMKISKKDYEKAKEVVREYEELKLIGTAYILTKTIDEKPELIVVILDNKDKADEVLKANNYSDMYIAAYYK